MSILEKILGYLNLARVTKSEALVLAPRMHGTWEQVKKPDSDIVIGFNWRCECRQEYKYGPAEALVSTIHKCEVCKSQFSLMRSLDPDGKATHTEYLSRLSNLSTKIEKSTATQQRTMQTVGDEPVKDTWSGMQVRGRDKSYETGDPGWMGPGF